MIANATKLDAELRAAAIPINGCASTGRIDFCPHATAEDKARAAAILAAHDPTPAPKPPTVDEQIAELAARVAKLEELFK